MSRPSALSLRIANDPCEIDSEAWNALLAAQARPTPFMRHEYLAALHRSRSAIAESGWGPTFLTLWEGKALVAGCALYLKGHSYGEYVFDWAWADAYERHALAYYPKLLCAVPFTPVPGTRLLARTPLARRALLSSAQAIARENGLSSVHLLFGDEADVQAAREEGWMLRSAVQFHWENASSPYRDFGQFLSQLQRDKRKKILQERRRVAEAGVCFTVHEGEAIDTPLWDFFYRCYLRTYREHGSTPYLTRAFFSQMQQHMARHWTMFVAHRNGQRIAASLVAVDPEQRVAYGRYWGAMEHVPLLHFEACYYQPLAWCIERGHARFEGGAQGEHKMARGLLPVRTQSAHWLAHPRFADAVASFLEREGTGIESYVDELRERNPFKRTPT